MLLTKFNWPLNDFNCATDVGHKLHCKWPAILDAGLQISPSMLHLKLVEKKLMQLVACFKGSFVFALLIKYQLLKVRK